VVPGLQLKRAEFAFCVHDPATSCTNVFVHFPYFPNQNQNIGQLIDPHFQFFQK